MGEELQLAVVKDSDKIKLTLKQFNISESFYINERPSVKSRLVIQSKKNICHDLDLKKLVVNLNNTADLMYVAYNALTGTKIQSKMSGLQKKLMDLCDECIIAMQDITQNTGFIIEQVIMAYDLLFQFEEEACIELIATCSEYAGEMAQTSERLAGKFSLMADDTEKILEETQDLYVLKEDAKKELLNEKAKIEAEQLGRKRLAEALKEEISQMNEEYQEAKEAAKSAEDKAFIMGCMSAITGAIGMGLGAAVGYSSPNLTIQRTINQQTAKQNTGADEEEKKKKEEEKKKKEEQKAKKQEEINKEKDQLKQVQADVEKIKQSIDKQKSQLKSETDAVQKSEIEKNLKDEEKKLEEKEAMQAELEKKIKKLEDECKDYDKEITALAAGLSSLTDSTGKMQEKLEDQAQTAQQTARFFLEKKLEMQKQNRQVLADIEEFAQKIKNMREEDMTIDTAMQMLQVAIKCLKQIVVALSTAALFWSGMKTSCEGLQKSAFLNQLKVLKKMSENTRRLSYMKENFVYQLILYLVNWTALDSVCEDYKEASKIIRGKVAKNIKSNLYGKEAIRVANDMADEIIRSMEIQITENDEDSKRINGLIESMG